MGNRFITPAELFADMKNIAQNHAATLSLEQCSRIAQSEFSGMGVTWYMDEKAAPQFWPTPPEVASVDSDIQIMNPDGSAAKVVINRELSRWTPEHGLDVWDGEIRYRCMAVAVYDKSLFRRETTFLCGRCGNKLPTPQPLRAPGDVCPECFSVAVSVDIGFAFHRDAFTFSFDGGKTPSINRTRQIIDMQMEMIARATTPPWVGPMPTITKDELKDLEPPPNATP